MKKTAAFWLIYFLSLILAFEFASRVYWNITWDVPLLTMKGAFYAFYPEAKEIDENFSSQEDEAFDILLLGGSVLHYKWTLIEKALKEKLSRETKREIRIHNASEAAHMTRDSYFKYQYFAERNFDLVIVYHGINDVRANNCPLKAFQKDYSHYFRYSLLSAYQKYENFRFFTFPFTLEFLKLNLLRETGARRFYSEGEKYYLFGDLIKTKESFRENMLAILNDAKKKNEKVLLMTFSYYVPDNYGLEKFKNRSLDYELYFSPIEIWGKMENVTKGIEAHNQVIRDISLEFDEVLFVDQDKLIPKEGLFFNDIGHLSYDGSKEFVTNLMPKVRKLL